MLRLERVDVAKIDIEGAEVLLGARKVLKEFHPAIVAEVRQHTWPFVRDVFRFYGYAFKWISEDVVLAR